MTTPDAVAQAQETLAHKHVIEAIREYADQRERAALAGKRKDAAAIVVRSYLDSHNEEPIKDGEVGWEAAYSVREGSGEFDWQHMDDAAILLLARAGAFKAESAAALALITKKDPEVGTLIKKWKVPGGEVKSLEIRNKP